MASDHNFVGSAGGGLVCAQAIMRLVPRILWDAQIDGVVNVAPFDFKTPTQDVTEEDPEPHSHPEPSPENGAIRISKIFENIRL